jgi:hypothetical protein
LIPISQIPHCRICMKIEIEAKYNLGDSVTLRKYPAEIVAIKVFSDPKKKPYYDIKRISDGIIVTDIPEKQINLNKRIVEF